MGESAAVPLVEPAAGGDDEPFLGLAWSEAIEATELLRSALAALGLAEEIPRLRGDVNVYGHPMVTVGRISPTAARRLAAALSRAARQPRVYGQDPEAPAPAPTPTPTRLEPVAAPCAVPMPAARPAPGGRAVPATRPVPGGRAVPVPVPSHGVPTGLSAALPGALPPGTSANRLPAPLPAPTAVPGPAPRTSGAPHTAGGYGHSGSPSDSIALPA